MNFRFSILALTLLLAAACNSPTKPTVQNPPPPPPPPKVDNAPPVIGAFTVQGTRPNEPANFADVSEEVPVNAVVTDADSTGRVGDLEFFWTAGVGTFIGSGTSVVWKAPASIDAPTVVTLTLEVVETYSSEGKNVENRVTSSTTVSLHDSVKEVGDMAVQFLRDFSDTGIKDASYVMRNFEPTCYGTADETADVAQHILNYTVTKWRVEAPATTIAFGGSCPFRAPLRPGDACVQVRTFWASTANRNVYDIFGNLIFKPGDTSTASGVDQVVAMYYKNQNRWRLCASDFNGDDPPQTSLFSRVRGLVP